MNERLQLILACIRVGRANVLTTRDIARMTNLSVRKVRGGIAEAKGKQDGSIAKWFLQHLNVADYKQIKQSQVEQAEMLLGKLKG